jgi:hypothetical protein
VAYRFITDTKNIAVAWTLKGKDSMPVKGKVRVFDWEGKPVEGAVKGQSVSLTEEPVYIEVEKAAQKPEKTSSNESNNRPISGIQIGVEAPALASKGHFALSSTADRINEILSNIPVKLGVGRKTAIVRVKGTDEKIVARVSGMEIRFDNDATGVQVLHEALTAGGIQRVKIYIARSAAEAFEHSPVNDYLVSEQEKDRLALESHVFGGLFGIMMDRLANLTTQLQSLLLARKQA